MTTRATYRVFKGEILAIFPDIPALRPKVQKSVLCYAQLDQHSAIDWNMIKRYKKATFDQYKYLAKELESIGYTLETI